jgi:hypothetical protein
MEELGLSLTPKVRHGNQVTTETCAHVLVPVFLTEPIFKKWRVCSCSSLHQFSHRWPGYMTWTPCGLAFQPILSCNILFHFMVRIWYFLPVPSIAANLLYFAVWLWNIWPGYSQNSGSTMNWSILEYSMSSLHTPAFLLLIRPRQWLLVEYLHPGHSVHVMESFFYALWRSDICTFPPRKLCSSHFTVLHTAAMIVSNAGWMLTCFCPHNTSSSPSTSTESSCFTQLTYTLLFDTGSQSLDPCNHCCSNDMLRVWWASHVSCSFLPC